MYFSLSFCVLPCRLMMYGIVVPSIGVPSGRVMVCTRPMPSTPKIALAILSMTMKSAGLRRSWSDSTINTSGLSRAGEKCRSAAAYPTLDSMSAGR